MTARCGSHTRIEIQLPTKTFYSLMKKLLFSLTLSFAALTGFAQSLSVEKMPKPQRLSTTWLFHTGDSCNCPYRIPAIACAKNGDLIALSDRRPCGSDIGYGRVDILCRVSHDNGRLWTKAQEVLVGSGEGKDAGYGDACLVADRDRNELLLVCVSGNVPYWKSSPENRQRLVTLHAKWNKKKALWQWETQPADLTSHIYDELLGGQINGLFMGSGRICQSRKVKVGSYYRLYAALCTHKGNYVIYSDDFGKKWSLLGTVAQSPAPQGDEPKCEELPDGSVVLSSRKHGGRYFNVFHFTDARRGEGQWDAPVDSRLATDGISNEGTPCNGEILIVPALDASGRNTYLALQSIPAGPARSHVTIYYKELASEADYATSEAFASNWDGAYEVTHRGSGYSTMVQQADGRIAFFFEEEPNYYQMVFTSLSLTDITGGQYTAK